MQDVHFACAVLSCTARRSVCGDKSYDLAVVFRQKFGMNEIRVQLILLYVFRLVFKQDGVCGGTFDLQYVLLVENDTSDYCRANF